MILHDPSDNRLSWPSRLGAALLGLAVLPIAPQRLGAQSTDDPPVPAVAEPADTDADAQRTRDLERRLRALEAKIDRLADDLLRSKRAEAERKDAGPPSPERDRPRDPVADERREQLERDIEALIDKVADPERRERLEREIEALVDERVDTDRLEKLGREVEALIEETLDPEHLEKLGREVEVIIKKAVDPERVERIMREIEAILKKAVGPERGEAIEEERDRRAGETPEAEVRNRLERDREKLLEQQAKDALERANRGEDRARPSRPETEPGALDRRLRALEERLERVLRELEARDEPPPK
jgi:hypothetical protein